MSGETGPPPARILVIDDEVQIRRFLGIALRSQGYEVLQAETAADGLAQAATRTPDLAVLDLGLPDADGKSVLQALRGWSRVPVLVLSVSSSEAEKVLALDCGANDYVTKPFGIQELLARVRGLLRDRGRPGEGSGTAVFDDGCLRIDLSRRQVTLQGEPVHHTSKEYALLAALLSHAGVVLAMNCAGVPPCSVRAPGLIPRRTPRCDEPPGTQKGAIIEASGTSGWTSRPEAPKDP